MTHVIGVDIGGTFIRVGIVNQQFEVFETIKFPVMSLVQEQGINGFNEFIVNYVNQHRQQYQIIGMQIGFPGVVDHKNKIVISVPNRHEFEGSEYIKDIEKKLNIPVFIDKDTNHLLVYDMKENQLEDVENVLGFYIGTGFGNSLKLQGKIYLGENGLAGEIGHIPIYGVEKNCGCGNIGCLETIVSGKHLVEIVESHYPNIPLDDIFTHASNEPHIIKFIDNMAMAIAIEINILDVTQIILGGGVVLMKDFPKELLYQSILAKIRSPHIKEKLHIYYSKANDNSGVIGAAILAFPKLIGDDANEN